MLEHHAFEPFELERVGEACERDDHERRDVCAGQGERQRQAEVRAGATRG